ncbi:KilA-N domain-containing protein [Thiohalorhabdus denitrificans]|uniref:KilA-N domain-containing protein n=1 Tax=Thiohalorhabdus denitrificans TaxID=381306 RepID=UPI0037DC3300
MPVNEHGRVSLNALHRASGAGSEKGPGRWRRSRQAQELAEELRPDVASDPVSVASTGSPGTYAHPDLGISYAGWIRPAFQVQVNRTFRQYQEGTLPARPSRGLLEGAPRAVKKLETQRIVPSEALTEPVPPAGTPRRYRGPGPGHHLGSGVGAADMQWAAGDGGEWAGEDNEPVE